MDYICYYDIIAAVLLSMLFALYFMRRNYPTSTNKAYLAMLICISLSTITDLVSIYTIPRADTLPLGLNYAINILYLLAYNGSAVSFYYYVLTLTKPKNTKVLTAITYITSAIIMMVLLPTPITKWGIYFDAQNNYQHGFLFPLLYICSLFLLVCVFFVYIQNRKKLNSYQIVSILFFNVVTIGAVIFQLIFPRHLVGNLASSLFLLLVYVSLQGPEHYIDSNNQCYNQNAFFETVNRYMKHNTPFTLVAFTLDGFQYINQVLGVPAGNELINSVVSFLHTSFGNKNVYRLTGCRFVIVLDDSEKEDTVTSVLMEYFKTPRTIQQLDVLLTPYICVIHYPDFTETTEDISNAIEYTLKTAISTHAQTAITASQVSLHESQRKTQIIHIMKRAIRNREFQVYYQPIYHIETGTFSSAEALIRLWDEQLGYIPPDEFIPMAEQNGMIIEIGEIVFRQVCAFIQNHNLCSLGVDYIEVNLSFVQCMQENLAQQLDSIMQEYDVAPNMINFEITETAGSVNANTLRRNMEKLIESGSSFSMDDYGTGFSTADYLVHLPLQLVKIDKSILWSAMEKQEAFIILRHTVEMLKDLRKKIVVEGVETQEMVDILTNMHCDYLQGYLYSKPLPEDNYIAFMQKHL